MSALILVVFLGGAVAAVPIAHALLLAAMAAAATSDRVPLDLLVQQMVAQVQSFPLIAIPVLHAHRRADDGRPARRGDRRHALRTGRPLARRAGAGQRAVVDAVRRRVRFGGGRRLGDRRAADAVAQQARLSDGLLGRGAGLGRDDRHHHPAVDPDDPVRADRQRVDRRAVLRRRPARPAAVRRLHDRVLVGRQAPQPAARDRARSTAPPFAATCCSRRPPWCCR